ncbi:TFIID-31kDa-domain-containing protein [Microstroma glucosiphilum]|uniref:TFIID-31kDa-domain-containing protein n=1 Tax=Pseudomicrostroma glucosiphilum TaxID=1684307 RepID=A0A316UFG5_9BASI|nr:TFIID-31kDa-domain-containing protein [Pseudomicrostroma glucosiphilum]PWN23151.1 TFIID-31kDa-domain-containing protein [Pseudomicrostroma glucosiphilum]
MPQDARLISLIIASMGIQDIEPGVEMMLLEWANRYIHTILSDALVYSSHAHSSSSSSSSNPQISLADLLLSVQSNLSHSLIQQPAKTTLLSLATTLNAYPLPPVSDRYGLRLPPREHCLTGVNFGIVPDELDDDDDDDEEDEEGEEVEGSAKAGDSRQGQGQGQGAGGGRDEVGEEDAEDGPLPEDATMEDAAGAGGGGAAIDSRGVKRSLDEDEDYD